MQTFPRPQQDLQTDVIVLGGGITGALAAEALTRRGAAVVVLDRRPIAHGSTSASTALLQYDVDEPLYSLQKQIGKQNAIAVYKLCAEAIGYVGELAGALEDDCEFRKLPSLYFSTRRRDPIALKQEYAARKAAGFDVEYLEGDEVAERYGFKARRAIRSALGAQIDPYRFAYRLLELVQRRGGAVFESTRVLRLATAGKVVLTTEDGCTITAGKIIFTVGYEAKAFLREKTADLISTYAGVTKPVAERLLWPERCLLWNTDDPYFYARTTSDNRILIGGEDIPYEDDDLRDALIPAKAKALDKKFHTLFPDIPIEIETTWAGTFGETKDSLPYIGASPEWENAWFALGYGGNGITFSAIAAEALADLYLGQEHAYLELFRFGR